MQLQGAEVGIHGQTGTLPDKIAVSGVASVGFFAGTAVLPNNGIVDGEKREVYREKFATNEKFRNQELEYILILTDRYIGFDKPQMLAKLYLAYLDEIINWMTFIKYAECIDRFLPGDQLVLDSGEIEKAQYNDNYDAVSRLEALGLIGRKVEVVPIYHEQEQNLELKNSDEYTLTGFGWKLKQILESY